MLNRLAALLSIPRGAENKTFLLFGMQLLFYIGLRWGDTAGQSLFQTNWGKDSMSVIFFLSAPIMLLVFVGYGWLTRRWSNERLLIGLTLLLVIWLVTVQALLLAGIGTGPQGLTYLYFYLGFLVFADTAALNLLNYVNDLYDTREAKQVLPFLLSAALAGAVVAGFTAPLLSGNILFFLPLIWAATLAGVLMLAWVAHRYLARELVQAEQARRGKQQTQHKGGLLGDFRLFQQWGILRWLAVSTLIVVILMRLLSITSTNLVNQSFSTQQEVFVFYNLLDGITSLIGLAISWVLIGRLMVRFGVGVMNMVFPVVTLVIVILLNPILVPGLFAAGLARENDRVIKKVFRNPIEAMFANSVPLNIKVQARAFINTATVPLGTFLAGAMGLLVKDGYLTAELAAWLGLAGALGYLAISWYTRQSYNRAMIRLVATDELAIFRAGYSADDAEIDPLTISQLAQRLSNGQDDDDTQIVLAEMLYDFQGRNAIRTLTDVAANQQPAVRAFITRLLGADWISEPPVRELCIKGLDVAALDVQRASATALATSPTPEQDPEVLEKFMRLLRQPDESLQASAIPVLLASGIATSIAPSMQVLSEWLSDGHDPERRVLGLRVLSQTADARLTGELTSYLSDASPLVRAQAIDSIGTVAIRSNQRTAQQQAVGVLRNQLSDEAVTVRLAIVDNLGRLNGEHDRTVALAAGSALIAAMHDRRLRVRRAASHALNVFPRAELEQAYRSEDSRVVESATFAFARVGKRRIGGVLIQRRLVEHCEQLVERHYRLRLYEAALSGLDTAGVRMLSDLYREQAQSFLKRAFWLLSAVTDEAAIDSIQRSLGSKTPRVRANALESLEAISSPRLAQMIGQLYEATGLDGIRQAARQLNLSTPSRWKTLQLAWPQLRDKDATSDALLESFDLLVAAGMVAAVEIVRSGAHDLEPAAAERVPAALPAMMQSEAPLLRETARLAHTLLDGSAKEQDAMLTVIEKVILLRRVAFFQNVLTSDLRLLASVGEETSFDIGQTIIKEDEPNDTLYIIVSGRVAVQHRKQAETERTLTELASLGPRDYFGEMSLLDEGPSSADVVALVPTRVLMLRRLPLFNLLERQPGIALNLFKGMSQRLRQANEQLARRPR